MVAVSVFSWSKLMSVNTGILNDGVSSMPGMLSSSMSKSLGNGNMSFASGALDDSSDLSCGVLI